MEIIFRIVWIVIKVAKRYRQKEEKILINSTLLSFNVYPKTLCYILLKNLFSNVTRNRSVLLFCVYYFSKYFRRLLSESGTSWTMKIRNGTRNYISKLIACKCLLWHLLYIFEIIAWLSAKTINKNIWLMEVNLRLSVDYKKQSPATIKNYIDAK